MGTSLPQLLREYVVRCGEVKALGQRVCHELIKVLEPYIPDIECYVGWEEGGINTLALYSRSHDINSHHEGLIDLCEAINNVIKSHIKNDMSAWFECPYGVYVEKEIADKVIKLLGR